MLHIKGELTSMEYIYIGIALSSSCISSMFEKKEKKKKKGKPFA